MGVPTYRKGFFCSDSSLKYPYKEDTISDMWLIIACVPLPIFLMFFTELITSSTTNKHNNLYDENVKKKIPIWMRNTTNLISSFLFGGISTVILSETIKLSTGNLRPHFWDVCRPNVSCPAITNMNEDVYLSEYNCLGDSGDLERKARHSFPSGQASISSFVTVFLCFYSHVRLKNAPSHFRGLCQMSLISVCLGAGVTRINDHMHHSIDVYAGLLLGSVVSLFVIFSLNPLPQETSIGKGHGQISTRTRGNFVLPHPRHFPKYWPEQ